MDLSAITHRSELQLMLVWEVITALTSNLREAKSSLSIYLKHSLNELGHELGRGLT